MVSSKLICGSSVVLLLACGSSGAAPSGRDVKPVYGAITFVWPGTPILITPP